MQEKTESEKIFLSAARKAGIPVSEELFAELRIFAGGILEKNAAINLISKNDEKRIWTRHILDSLQLLKLLNQNPRECASAADIGSGAGFPGIPLAAALRGKTRFTLIEPGGKRSGFLRWTAVKMRLADIEVKQKRANEIKREFPLVLQRALGKIPDILPMCLKLVSKGGLFVSWHSSPGEFEAGECVDAMTEYNAKIITVMPYSLPEDERERFLVAIRRKA